MLCFGAQVISGAIFQNQPVSPDIPQDHVLLAEQFRLSLSTAVSHPAPGDGQLVAQRPYFSGRVMHDFTLFHSPVWSLDNSLSFLRPSAST